MKIRVCLWKKSYRFLVLFFRLGKNWSIIDNLFYCNLQLKFIIFLREERRVFRLSRFRLFNRFPSVFGSDDAQLKWVCGGEEQVWLFVFMARVQIKSEMMYFFGFVVVSIEKKRELKSIKMNLRPTTKTMTWSTYNTLKATENKNSTVQPNECSQQYNLRHSHWKALFLSPDDVKSPIDMRWVFFQPLPNTRVHLNVHYYHTQKLHQLQCKTEAMFQSGSEWVAHSYIVCIMIDHMDRHSTSNFDNNINIQQYGHSTRQMYTENRHTTNDNFKILDFGTFFCLTRNFLHLFPYRGEEKNVL